MINVLLSFYDFGEDELYQSLSKYIREDMRVSVIPFSHSEEKMPTVSEYDTYCNKGGKYFEMIAEQFGKLGIPYNNIYIIHYYKDSLDTMKDKIINSDIIFFTGGLPDKTMERLEKKGLIDTIKTFEGIVMGASAGALIQLSEYFCTPDEDYHCFGFYNGLGLVEGDFYIEVHYEGAPLKEDFPFLEKKSKKIFAIPDKAGLICQNDSIEIVGDVKVI